MATNTPPPQMAIDPALQQQSSGTQQYSQYTHYPSAAYNSQSYAQPQPTIPAASAGGGAGGRTSGDDLATMNDALGSAGIDLRAEEESLHRGTSANTYSSLPLTDRTRTQNSISPYFLSTTLQAICQQHALPRKIPDDAVNYLALATRMRLEELIEKMVRVAKHRENARFDREPGAYNDAGGDGEGEPMWNIKIRRDVKKQLDALEKAEREEELRLRRERKERQEAANAALDTLNQSGSTGSMEMDDDDQPAKKKRKKDAPGPTVQAKNLSEDVRKKLSDDTASQAAGRKKYAWMNVSSSATPAKASSPKPSASTPSTPVPSGPGAGPGGWAKAYVPRNKSALGGSADDSTGKEREGDRRMEVSLRDAMFVVCGERGHGGGRGSARPGL